MFYCMFYFTCDRSFTRVQSLLNVKYTNCPCPLVCLCPRCEDPVPRLTSMSYGGGAFERPHIVKRPNWREHTNGPS